MPEDDVLADGDALILCVETLQEQTDQVRQMVDVLTDRMLISLH